MVAVYVTPAKGDLDRNLSTIMHDAHHKAQDEKERLTAEMAARGLALSGNLISAVVKALDTIYKEALERASPMLRDFAERMEMSPSEIASIARPHLQNMGNAVLGQLPPAGFPEVHQQVLNQYRAVFEQRLEGMLRDFEIGFAGGRNHVRGSETPSTQPSTTERSLMTDAEIRGKLLEHFYNLRHSNGGWVPISETVLAPEPVELRVIGGVCQQLADIGLIQWKPLLGAEGNVAGMAKITGKGVAAVESGHSSEIDIRLQPKNETVPSTPSSKAAFTLEAANAVYAAIERLVSSGKRAYSLSVPFEAERLLVQQRGGKISRADASNQIKAAMIALVEEGKIEASMIPREDWLIKEPLAEGTAKAATGTNDPISDAALTEILEAVNTIKAELPALRLSNTEQADIVADIKQIEAETERPAPRRPFMKLYLESLRDNLARAAGAATVGGLLTLAALVGNLIAKHFGIF